MKRQKIYFDALPLSVERIGGIGHNLYGLLRAFLKDPYVAKNFEVVLVTSARGLKYLKHWRLDPVTYRAIPLPTRVFNRLPVTHFMPPMDLYLGKGLYIFTNYRSWPLAFSRSATFIHDASYMRYPETVGRRNQQVLETNVPRWIRRTDRILTLSNFSQKEVEHFFHVRSDKIDVVYCGVDTGFFYPRPKAEVKQIAAKYNLPDDYILCLGTVEPRKNIERLVRAYKTLPATLKARHPLCIIGGQSWLSEAIDKEINSSPDENIVRPKVYVPDEDLPAIYSGAHVLAFPTLYEGFGIPPIQAMACGVPVLVGNNSSLPEVVGDAGVYVDPLSDSDIAEKLKTVITDNQLREKLVKDGLKRVKQFSWENSAAQLVNSVKKLNESQD